MNLQTTFQKFNQTQKAFGPWGFIRQNGFRYFSQAGLPSKQNEDYKYTSFKNLSEALLEPQNYSKLTIPKDFQNQIKPYLRPGFVPLVFLNGALVLEMSDLQGLGAIKTVGLQEVEQTTVFQAVRKARKQVGKLRQDAMEALNSAFAYSGVVLEVPANTSLGKPVQILYYQDSDKATYPKTLVKVGAGSKLSLIETFVSTSKKSFTNAVSEFVVEPSAKLEYNRVQEEGPKATHVGCTRIFLKKESSLEALSYATGALLNRHNFDIYCLGEQAFAQVNGLTLGADQQHHDNHTLIDHVVGNCTTTQLYKSILDDDSRTVFNGKVSIREKAQKASSEQLNNNLILSSKAEADSKPELSIFADDVKATHGSTVGQLNEDELFYFLSRAIPQAKAVEMLSLGFVNELIDRVSDEAVRTWLHERLLQAYKQMKGGPS